MTGAEGRGGTLPPPDEPSGPGRAGATLESFVALLHDEGIEAGRREAERLVGAARAEAEEILRAARAEAGALLDAALARSAEEETRVRAELELATRDAVLQLQATLAEVLRAAIARGVRAELSDGAFLKTLLLEVVTAYARADAAGRPTEVHLPRSLRDTFASWWLRELATSLTGAEAGPAPSIAAILEDAGFEYRVGGGTVEVSVDAATEKLMELVRPGLRELVAGAAARDAGPTPGTAVLAGAHAGRPGPG